MWILHILGVALFSFSLFFQVFESIVVELAGSLHFQHCYRSGNFTLRPFNVKRCSMSSAFRSGFFLEAFHSLCFMFNLVGLKGSDLWTYLPPFF